MADPALIAFLRTVSLFRDFAEPHLLSLAPRLRERKLKKADVLFREGDPGQEMFLIQSGSIIISKPITGRVEQVLARMGPGEFFGEMSLVDGGPCSATVEAATDMRLLVVGHREFWALLTAAPPLVAKIMSTLSRRVRDAEASVSV